MRCWDSPRSCAHGAERAVRREHEGLLVDWALREPAAPPLGRDRRGGPGGRRLRPRRCWLILLDAGRVVDAGGILLLAYWALNMPLLGEEIALLARQYPLHRSTTLRLLEPLGAPEEDDGERMSGATSCLFRLPEPTGWPSPSSPWPSARPGIRSCKTSNSASRREAKWRSSALRAPASRPWSGSCWAGTVPHPGGSWSRASRRCRSSRTPSGADRVGRPGGPALEPVAARELAVRHLAG